MLGQDETPATWHCYKDDVRVWILEMYLNYNYSTGARMIRKERGSATRKAMEIADQDLMPAR